MTTPPSKETVHVIRPGECVESIAFTYGLTAEFIWDHENNAELRKVRERRDVLLADDKVFVPEVRPKTEAVSTAKSTTFIAKRALRKVRIQLMRDSDEAPPPPKMLNPNEYANPVPPPPRAKPWADVAVQMTGTGFTWSGQTDADGKLRADVPMSATTARLTVAVGTEEERQFELQFGQLDPLDTATGVAQRLSNQGFRTPVSDEATPHVVNALKQFQYARGLPITGEADEKTRAELRK